MPLLLGAARKTYAKAISIGFAESGFHDVPLTVLGEHG